MLVFQVATLASKNQALADGAYSVPVRSTDGGDCVSTISLPGGGSADWSSTSLAVRVVSMEDALNLAEAGRSVASILADASRVGRGTLRGELARGEVGAERIIELTLLRYGSVEEHSRTNWFVVQRELRRKGLDICYDEAAILVGYVEDIPGREAFAVYLVGRFDNLSDRDGALIDRDAFRQKRALIIGLGSLGSAVACDLARSGVGQFVVADGERLEWGNVVRHAAGLSDVGRLKSRIVADLIRDRNPEAEVSEISLELASGSRNTYAAAVAAADVVICATDSRASRLMCNRLCVRYSKKVIFGGLSTGAYAGMVFQFKPPETMCYHCFVNAFPMAAVDKEVNESDYAGGPDGHLALDIGPIANLVAKLAVVNLQQQVGTAPVGLDAALVRPWYIWINRREGEYADDAGYHILRWYPIHMEKDEDCPHCGTEPA